MDILVRRDTDLRLDAVQEVPWEGAPTAIAKPRRRCGPCQAEPDHGSGRRLLDVAAHCRLRPGRTALLRRLRVERKASGEASSVMTRACGGELEGSKVELPLMGELGS
jgi:hypothetical protein